VAPLVAVVPAVPGVVLLASPGVAGVPMLPLVVEPAVLPVLPGAPVEPVLVPVLVPALVPAAEPEVPLSLCA
jgi:hypothetical protein